MFAPALEAKFQADTSRDGVGVHRIIWPVSAIIWGALALHDPTVAGSAANLALIREVRWALLVPLVLVAATGWLPLKTFVRVRVPLASLGTLTLLAGPLIMSALMPEPMATEPTSAALAVSVTIFVTSVWCGATGLPLVLPVLAVMTQAIGFTLLRDKFPGRQEGGPTLWYCISAALGWMTAWLLDSARRRTFRAVHAMEREQARSERLLHSVFPTSIAERLMTEPARIADKFGAATILFGDIVGFTSLSAELPPEEMVRALDALFSRFDDLAKKYGLEKIKTIGDAYMVVGGVPQSRVDHADAVAQMGLEMRDLIRNETFAGQPLKMRIGISSGPVVAGVIGKQKFIYDLWGDAVNTASRMESQGVDGAVQVSESTYELLRGRYELTPRGTVEVKGKGPMRTWLLQRRLRVDQSVIETM